jgi:hypothetical protein
MDLENRLRDALSPCEPGPKPELAVMSQLAALRGKPRRMVVVTCIVALAAAAGMLGAGWRHFAHPASLPAEPAAESTEISASAPTFQATPASSTETVSPVISGTGESTTAEHIEPTTVFVLPLQNHAVDDRHKVAVELFYSSLLAGLIAQSSLTVVMAPLPAESARPYIDYRLTIKGGQSIPEDKFQVIVSEGERKISEDRFSAHYVSVLKGDTGTTCDRNRIKESQTTRCTDPASLAAQVVATLVEKVLVRDRAPAPALPSDGVRTDQYRSWMASVEEGSPLANLLNEAYSGIDRGTWSFAKLIMELHDKMMSSPEDLEGSRRIELDILQAMRELPPELSKELQHSPIRCRLAMCSMHIPEITDAVLPDTARERGVGSSVAAGLIINALQDKGLLSGDSGSPLIGARFPTMPKKGGAFLFLTRRNAPQTVVE